MKKAYFFLFFMGCWAAGFAQDSKDKFLIECIEEAQKLNLADKRKEALVALQNCEKGTDKPKVLYLIYIMQSELHSNLATLVKQNRFLSPNANYQNAVNVLEKATRLDSIQHEAYSVLSLLNLYYQNYEKALIYANIAIHRSQFIRDREERKQQLLAMMNNRSTIKAILNDMEGAVEDLQEILRIDSLNLAIYSNLSLQYSRMEQHDKSIATLLKAYKIDSKDENILMNLGFVYQQAGHYEESIRYYDEFERLLKSKKQGYDGALGLFYNNRGFSKFKLGKVQEGLEDINRSLKFYPENSWAYKNRALVYLELGEKEKACADLQQAEDYGYSKHYGEEVQNLLKKHCQKGKK